MPARSILLLLLFLPSSRLCAQPEPDEPELPFGFIDEEVVGGLTKAIGMRFLPDGQMLIIEKGGKVIIVEDPDAQPVVTRDYLTLENIDTVFERGLLDLAIDPDFENNSYVYFYYSWCDRSLNPPCPEIRPRISRFEHDDDPEVVLASEFVVWEQEEDYATNSHHGGGLDFGPDGKIYLTLGDQYYVNEAQLETSTLGKVIRVNPDRSAPSDNPFYDGEGGPNDLVWALGLRNPFRARWGLPSERFFIGDVGGNILPNWEEINLGAFGANFGWEGEQGSGAPVLCEGPCCCNDCCEDDPPNTCGTLMLSCSQVDSPIYSYPHPVANSIIGGVVYRGTQFPSKYLGAYFHGNLSGWIKYLTFDGAGEASTHDFVHSLGTGLVAI